MSFEADKLKIAEQHAFDKQKTQGQHAHGLETKKLQIQNALNELEKWKVAKEAEKREKEAKSKLRLEMYKEAAVAYNNMVQIGYIIPYDVKMQFLVDRGSGGAGRSGADGVVAYVYLSIIDRLVYELLSTTASLVAR